MGAVFLCFFFYDIFPKYREGNQFRESDGSALTRSYSYSFYCESTH